MYEQLVDEIIVEAARSGGPGGQKVNKTNSKAVARLNVDVSVALTETDKAMLHQSLKLTTEGDLVVRVSTERSWHQNREIAIERLIGKIQKALTPETPRRETKVPRWERRQRLNEKKRRSAVKQHRRAPKGEDL